MQASQNTCSSQPRYQRLDVTDPDQAHMDPSKLKDRITTEQASSDQRQPLSTNRSNMSGHRLDREGDLEEEPDMDEDEGAGTRGKMGAGAEAGRQTGAYDYSSKDYDDL
ncbi:hypothetical protein BDW66DRAFT_152298 [Aspergillus desertorum]